MNGVMTIGQLAAAAQVKTATIRYYEQLGLLPKARRTPAGYREYSPGTVRRLALIRNAQRFGFSLRESAFASWVGLRGAVPIYLSIIPALADPSRDQRLFASIFIVVIASLVVEGWTVAPAARLLGFGRRA